MQPYASYRKPNIAKITFINKLQSLKVGKLYHFVDFSTTDLPGTQRLFNIE